MRRTFRILVLSLGVVGAAACADDVPRPTGPVSVGPISLAQGPPVGGLGRLLTKADGPQFSGVAEAMLAGTTCSGALVTASADCPDAPAYLLTAGHCAGTIFAPPDEVRTGVDLKSAYAMVKFRSFADSPDAATTVHASTTLFATMKGLDVALVGLASTRAQLRAAGVVPFVLSDVATVEGETVAVAGHPNLAPATLTACTFRRRLPLVLEGPYHWFDAEADDCQGIAGGSSGSPVFSIATGKVVAVQNTVAEELIPGFAPCQLNHPCEVGAAGPQYAGGTSYSMGVTGLLRCFDAEGALDLQRDGCPLDRGVQMLPSPDQVSIALSQVDALVPLTIALAPNGLTHYRYAWAPAGSEDCRQVSPYGLITAWADQPSIQISPRHGPGITVLCIQAGIGPDLAVGWQDLATPTVVVVSVFSD